MKRPSFISWDQLKVGAVIVGAIAVLAVTMYKLGQAANLFSKRYQLTAFLKEATGLRVGGSVLVAGQLAGSIKQITFLPVDADTLRNLRVLLSVDERIAEQVRGDSKARVKTMGLLGDKVLDISPGTPATRPLKDGDTLKVQPSFDLEEVLTRASGAVDDVVGLTHDMKQLTGALLSGKGTVGQLLTNPALYNQLEGTLRNTNALLSRVQSSRGTLARFLDDPRMYDEMVTTISSVDSLVMAMKSRNGSMGRLLTDTTLYTEAVGIVRSMGGIAQTADSLAKSIARGQGSLGKAINSDEMYDALLKFIRDFTAMLADIKRDPSRYTKGLIKVF